jgi:hypothetical protein
MTIKIRYNRAFDIEDVCPGDVLIDRADQSIMYAVVHTDPEAEEFICIRVNMMGIIKSLMQRIGYEMMEQYILLDIEEAL